MKSYLVLATFCVLSLFCKFSHGQEEDCPDFRPVGCYKDKHWATRAMGELLITDRNPNSEHKIDWLNFGPYMEGLECRCAKKAQENGWTHFGLQFYGECWGGPMAAITFARYGKSDECVDEYYADCEGLGNCIGKADANFVYQIIDPSGSGGGEYNPLQERTIKWI